MLKKKFKVTMTDKDAATDVMYHTFQAIKLENDNFILFISDDEKKMQKADLAEH
jgi:citrate lyase beta subunit